MLFTNKDATYLINLIKISFFHLISNSIIISSYIQLQKLQSDQHYFHFRPKEFFMKYISKIFCFHIGLYGCNLSNKKTQLDIISFEGINKWKSN